MRVLFERSRSARGLVVAAASAAVLALVHAAAAGDDLGIRRTEFWPEPQAVAVAEEPVPVPRPPRHARRIWAASRSRPLRVALDRRRPRARVAHDRLGGPFRLARLRPSPEPQVVFPRLAALPKPPRPAVVSIYQDKTLRDGDAVMMADGIHLFHGVGVWPYRPKDFVRLPLVTALDWHLRQTLDALDRNPPTRWSSVETTSG